MFDFFRKSPVFKFLCSACLICSLGSFKSILLGFSGNDFQTLGTLSSYTPELGAKYMVTIDTLYVRPDGKIVYGEIRTAASSPFGAGKSYGLFTGDERLDLCAVGFPKNMKPESMEEVKEDTPDQVHQIVAIDVPICTKNGRSFVSGEQLYEIQLLGGDSHNTFIPSATKAKLKPDYVYFLFGHPSSDFVTLCAPKSDG